MEGCGKKSGVGEERRKGKFNAVVLNDNLSNFKSRNSVNPEIIIKALDGNSIIPYLPDIVITYGANFQERIKDLLKANERKFEHWLITEDGKVKDCFRSQTKLFECSISYFVDRISGTVCHLNDEYLKLWKKLNDSLAVRDLSFSNFSVVRDFSEEIPDNSILHLSILNATRLMQFFDLSDSITVYSNANSFGIDGCLPTFLGQAYAFDGPAFIVIGDLAFFYAMNAMGIRHITDMTKVITYGTYDLLHYGHIRLLERAKALGDYLIVGVTADDFPDILFSSPCQLFYPITYLLLSFLCNYQSKQLKTHPRAFFIVVFGYVSCLLLLVVWVCFALVFVLFVL